MTTPPPKDGQVTIEKLGPVLRLTMQNPAKKNALSRKMYLDLAAALADTAEDNSIRAVWLRGSDGVFSSGNDVNGFAAAPGEEPAPVQFVRALMNYPKPIVAQVEGLAVGIGVTLLLHCDLIYAAEDTRFRMPFVNLGVVPEAGSSFILPRLMGAAKAAELILLGRMFSAREALDLNLINGVLPQSEVAAAAENAVTALSKQPLHAMMKSRALLRGAWDTTLEARVSEEFELFFEGLKGPEFSEAIRAFSEKREPDFSKIG